MNSPIRACSSLTTTKQDGNSFISKSSHGGCAMDAQERDKRRWRCCFNRRPKRAPYPIAILDLQMQEPGGLSLARKINSDPLLSATRLIMLTPFGKPISADELKTVNLAACCVKPVRQSALFNCIVQALTSPAIANEGQQPESFLFSAVPPLAAKRAYSARRGQPCESASCSGQSAQDSAITPMSLRTA